METEALFWKQKTQNELDLALVARKAGNEGKARVCSRRAAGYIAGEYLRRIGVPADSSSAYTRLQILQARPELTPAAREIVAHLLQRSTPDFTLPIPVDLIAEARQLAFELLGDDLHST